jgi:hypothetical protein
MNESAVKQRMLTDGFSQLAIDSFFALDTNSA